MKVNHQYIPGWIDTSIHDFLLDITEISSGMSYTIIACLDSCSEVSSMVKKSKHFQSVINNYSSIGNSLLVKTKDLVNIESENRIFFGFDEIWFIPQKSFVLRNSENGTNIIDHNLVQLQNQQIDLMDSSTALTLVSPHKLESTSIQKLVDLMRLFNLSCILGDGVGMNYLLKKSQQTLMSHLLKAYNQSDGNLIYTETQ
jgi:hypothetical protein